MTDTNTLSVGQEVWLYTRYGGKTGPRRVTITGIGRKLVTLSGTGNSKYRIESGSVNDAYGSSWFKTDEQRVEDDQKTLALTALRDAGLEIRLGSRLRLSADQVERIVAIAQEQS